MNEITTIAQTVAIISACWAIASGINAWKREFIGKRRIELAEQVIAKFFEIRDAIAYVRNPSSLPSEGKSRQKGSSELSQAPDHNPQQRVVSERHSRKESVFAEFYTLKYRFMATFGPDTERIFTDTKKVIHFIFFAVHRLETWYWKRQGREMPEHEFKKHLEEMNRFQSIIWDNFEDSDEIKKQLDEIQVKLELATAECFQEPVSSFKKMIRGGSKRLKHLFSDP